MAFAASKEKFTISAPNIKVVQVRIRGTASFVQAKFSTKARQIMRDKQAAGDKAKIKKGREAKDFESAFVESMYETASGARGFPAAALRNAMISACRVAGLTMTRAKLSVFVKADDIDKNDGTQLVLFTKGEPSAREDMVRNATGVSDIRVRAEFKPGWEAMVRIEHDADQIETENVLNLLMRAGRQVGIGEGRHDSRESAGMGWGTFEIVNEK
jgi:hypothetical protein